MKIIIQGTIIFNMVTDENEPSLKLLLINDISGENDTIMSVNALKILLTATPIKITVLLDALNLKEKTHIRNAATKAPAKEKTEYDNALYMPVNAQMAIPKPAPALIPTMLGDARLLANTACTMTPETASAPPQIKEAITRGSRTYKIIRPSGESNPSNIDKKDTSVLPEHIPNITTMTSKEREAMYKALV